MIQKDLVQGYPRRMTWEAARARTRRTTLTACLLFLPFFASAHPADISHLRVKVERQRLEFRFTLNLFVLGRLVTLDPNDDRQMDATELAATRPALEKAVQELLLLRVNDQPASLGKIQKFEPLWPPVASVDPRELDRSVDVVFTLTTSEVIANVWMEFTGFPKLGDQATLETTFEQGDLRLQVPFSQSEPDYLYDTGFAVEGIFQPITNSPAPGISWTAVAAGSLGMIALWFWRRQLARR